MILIIDNYDSFTYNLYQMVATIHPDVKVVRNDAISLKEIEKMQPDGIIISPGPGVPQDAGITLDVIKEFYQKIPILGVCLGHQAMAEAFGGKVTLSGEIVHGKSTLIFHTRKGIFDGMPLPFQAGRYHSLIVTREDVPENFIVEAETEEGKVMGMRHSDYPCFGVQFHPESILTPQGEHLITQFLKVCQVC